ncbi:MAG: sugar phosphate nucleotidyltransferase [bacterium]
MIKTLAMVLAGGEGERLSVLTQRRAKPVVPFGGMYRIVDFVLSNIVNSGIRDLGLLIQYQPDSMLKHLSFAWTVDRNVARLDILFPRRAHEPYESPADAIFKRLDYILDKNPVYVVIVPGDYVSLIDFTKIIDFHEKSEADLTVAGTMVDTDKTNRFGMMTVNEDYELLHYVEKPEGKVQTRFASMGIYVFTLDVLVRRLVEEERLAQGGTISFTYGMLPRMIGRDRVCAYPFEGYWRDVGTVDSYFEANLELIKIMPELNLYDSRHPLRSRLRFEPPAKICEYGSVKNSIITQGCLVDGRVERSIIFPHVRIDKGAEVYDSLIMPNNHIGSGTVIRRSILDTVSRQQHIDNRPNIGRDSIIGGYGEARPNIEKPNTLNSSITLIGMESEIPDNTLIGRNCIIYPDVRASDFDSGLIGDGESVHPKVHKSS